MLFLGGQFRQLPRLSNSITHNVRNTFTPSNLGSGDNKVQLSCKLILLCWLGSQLSRFSLQQLSYYILLFLVLLQCRRPFTPCLRLCCTDYHCWLYHLQTINGTLWAIQLFCVLHKVGQYNTTMQTIHDTTLHTVGQQKPLSILSNVRVQKQQEPVQDVQELLTSLTIYNTIYWYNLTIQYWYSNRAIQLYNNTSIQ